VVIEHKWWECRPAFLLTESATTPKVDKVWRAMSDSQRHRFHKFTCEDDKSSATIEVIYQMRAALNREGVE
jgi:hypothetical protein